MATLVNGSKLFADLTGGSTYAEIADLKEMGPPGDPTAPNVDVTPLAPSTSFRSYLVGLFDAGEFMFKQYWTKARMTALITPRNARTLVTWRIALPDDAVPADASRFEFSGFVTKATLEPQGNPDEPLVISCTVRITGAITYTETT
jgi:hypothetical protein